MVGLLPEKKLRLSTDGYEGAPTALGSNRIINYDEHLQKALEIDRASQTMSRGKNKKRDAHNFKSRENRQVLLHSRGSEISGLLKKRHAQGLREKEAARSQHWHDQKIGINSFTGGLYDAKPGRSQVREATDLLS